MQLAIFLLHSSFIESAFVMHATLGLVRKVFCMHMQAKFTTGATAKINGKCWRVKPAGCKRFEATDHMRVCRQRFYTKKKKKTKQKKKQKKKHPAKKTTKKKKKKNPNKKQNKQQPINIQANKNWSSASSSRNQPGPTYMPAVSKR